MNKTVPSPEEVLALAHKITDAKQVLSALEQQWSELFTSRNFRSRVVNPKGTTLMDKVFDLLRKHETEMFSAFDIAARTGANRNSIGPMLSRLVSEGKIEKRGHGTYGAVRDVTGFKIERTENPDAA